MASVVQSSLPSLPYNLTIARKQDTDTSQPLSPRYVSLPLSPSPSLTPPICRLPPNARLAKPNHSPQQRPLPLSPISKTPATHSNRHPTRLVAPPRPPRPQNSLPNLRPTIILSPDLIFALPAADRPSFPLPNNPFIPSRSSASSFYSKSSGEQFSSPLPSPAFFAPQTWSKQSDQTSPTAYSRHSRPSPTNTSSSPRSTQSSQTSPDRYYHNSKWHYQTITPQDSLTALPPLMSGPPNVPLPLPPTSVASASTSPEERQGNFPISLTKKKKRTAQDKQGAKENEGTQEIRKTKKKTKGKGKGRDREPENPKEQRPMVRQPSNAEKISIAPTPPPFSSLHLAQETKLGVSSRTPPHHLHSGTCPGCPPASPSQSPSTQSEHAYSLSYPHPLCCALVVDVEEEHVPPVAATFWGRHKRRLMILITMLAVLSITAGILAGVIWKLLGEGKGGYAALKRGSNHDRR